MVTSLKATDSAHYGFVLILPFLTTPAGEKWKIDHSEEVGARSGFMSG